MPPWRTAAEIANAELVAAAPVNDMKISTHVLASDGKERSNL